MERLEQIVAGLERDQIGVDELSDQIKEATALLNKCRRKLSAIEELRLPLSNSQTLAPKARRSLRWFPSPIPGRPH